jgi:hypothetical protein
MTTTQRTYTRTLNVLVGAAFAIGAALTVTVDFPESVSTSHDAYGNEPWEFVPAASAQR